MGLITKNYIDIIHYGVVDEVTESCHLFLCAKSQRKKFDMLIVIYFILTPSYFLPTFHHPLSISYFSPEMHEKTLK
jgi:hypothetical protein